MTKESYEAYRSSPREDLSFFALGAAAGTGIGLLFYRSVWGLIPGLLAGSAVLFLGRHKLGLKKREQLSRELRDYLLSVVSYLRAGYALENAMIGAEKELLTMHGADGLMEREARQMTRQLELQTPPEQLWRDFGDRSGLSDGEQLARIFSVAKRQGGDYLPVLKAMVRMMDERAGLKQEIAVLLAGQRLEYLIMCLVPAGMLVYLDLSSPGLTEALYEGSGPLFMTGFLLLYGGAALLGDRILEKSYEP